MKRTITSKILVSYSQCPRKAYLLLCTNQRGTPNEYMSILQQQKQALQRDYIKELQESSVLRDIISMIEPRDRRRHNNGALWDERGD